MPRSPKRMLISLESVPMVPLGMQNRLTFFTLPGEPQAHLLFGEFLRAAARAQHHADFALLLQRQLRGIHAGIAQRFGRRRQRQRHYARNMLALVRVHPGQLVEVLNFAGNLHGQLAGIEAADALHAADAVKHGAAERLVANTVGADRAHSRDDDAFFHRLAVSIASASLASMKANVVIQTKSDAAAGASMVHTGISFSSLELACDSCLWRLRIIWPAPG